MSAIKILSGLDISGTTSDVVINGNLGIGRSDPQKLLHIDGTGELLRLQGSLNDNPFISFYQDDDLIRRGYIQWNDVENSLKLANEYGQIRFNTGDNGNELPRMVILSGGSVGIGTNTPDARLDVVGLMRTTNAAGTPTVGKGLETFYSTGSDYAGIQAYDRDNATWEKLRINNLMWFDGSDRVGIGTSSPSYKLDVNSGTDDITARFNTSSTNAEILLSADDTNCSRFIRRFEDNTYLYTYGKIAFYARESCCSALYFNGSTRFRTLSNGACIIGCGFATDFIAQSDCRLKENFTPIEDPIEITMGLCGQKFNWKNNKEEIEYGLIAQDVEKISPELVSCQKLDLSPDDDSEQIEEYNKLGIIDYIMGVKYEKVVPILIEAIKKQQLEIKEIKEKLQLLENKNN